MDIIVSDLTISRLELIDDVLNGFYEGDFYRYTICVTNKANTSLIATRFTKDKHSFEFTFVKQLKDSDGDWIDDNSKDYIPFLKGSLDDIHNVISEDVYNSIVPTMEALLSE